MTAPRGELVALTRREPKSCLHDKTMLCDDAARLNILSFLKQEINI
jgi:hypothetical protein